MSISSISVNSNERRNQVQDPLSLLAETATNRNALNREPASDDENNSVTTEDAIRWHEDMDRETDLERIAEERRADEDLQNELEQEREMNDRLRIVQDMEVMRVLEAMEAGNDELQGHPDNPADLRGESITIDELIQVPPGNNWELRTRDVDLDEPVEFAHPNAMLEAAIDNAAIALEYIETEPTININGRPFDYSTTMVMEPVREPSGTRPESPISVRSENINEERMEDDDDDDTIVNLDPIPEHNGVQGRDATDDENEGDEEEEEEEANDDDDEDAVDPGTFEARRAAEVNRYFSHFVPLILTGPYTDNPWNNNAFFNALLDERGGVNTAFTDLITMVEDIIIRATAARAALQMLQGRTIIRRIDDNRIRRNIRRELFPRNNDNDENQN